MNRSANTLSGGESQRIKLAKELSKIYTGRTLYILDEPSIGLHSRDTIKLIQILKQLKNFIHQIWKKTSRSLWKGGM